jgi:NAD(P)-dependent dehydrogenase (short-subunit alcohol dehydrogenase family)
VPVGRIGTAEELATSVAFLSSDKVGYINGMILDFNGGSFMP